MEVGRRRFVSIEAEADWRRARERGDSSAAPKEWEKVS